MAQGQCVLQLIDLRGLLIHRRNQGFKVTLC